MLYYYYITIMALLTDVILVYKYDMLTEQVRYINTNTGVIRQLLSSSQIPAGLLVAFSLIVSKIMSRVDNAWQHDAVYIINMLHYN